MTVNDNAKRFLLKDEGWQRGELYMPRILDEEIGPDDTRKLPQQGHSNMNQRSDPWFTSPLHDQRRRSEERRLQLC